MKNLVVLLFVTLCVPIVNATGNPDLFRGLFLESPTRPKISLVVELSRGTLSIIKSKGDKFDVVEQVPVSIGKNGYGKQIEGDKRTPVGIYQINSFLKDEDLPEQYGPGAFTLDYPNVWDKRKNRTGSGIWIHGIDRGLLERPFLDSDGCVVLDNRQFDRLKPWFDKRPDVILVDKLPEVDPLLVDEIKDVLSNWEAAWESLDVDRYLAFYADSFANSDSDINAWREHKKRVGTQKTFISVSVDQRSIERYPNEKDLLRIDFRQRYESNNYNGTNNKRQLWQRQNDGQWKIIYEDSM